MGDITWWFKLKWALIYWVRGLFEKHFPVRYVRWQYDGVGDNPGKFELGPDYAAYMWHKLLLWGEHPDYDYMDALEEQYLEEYREAYGKYPGDWEMEYADPVYIWSFEVTEFERKVWPELEGIDKVYLREDDYGFVYSWEE